MTLMNKSLEESYEDIFNWDAIFSQTDTFQNNTPFKYAFVKGIFKQDFYDRLYETFPKSEDFSLNNDYRRSAKTRIFHEEDPSGPQLDSSLSLEWNLLNKYMFTSEFMNNFSKFTGVKLSRIIRGGFFANGKGDFQLPHIDEDGEFKNKIQLMFYFSKGWQKGDPGGTYLSTTDDESSIFFEPHDLDNTMICFQEASNAWHGTRFISKDVVRQALSTGLV